MSATAVAVAFSVSGGLCELAGLGFVIRGIAADRAHARKLFARRPVRSQPTRRYPSAVSATMITPSYANPLYASSEHIRGVIRHLQETEAAVANGFLRMRQAVDAELDQAIDHMRKQVAVQDDELRDHLRYVLAGSVRDRVIGAPCSGSGSSSASAAR